MSPLQRTFWLGAGLILLTNAVALGGVYYNRSGEPDSVFQLSERELTVAYRGFLEESESSGRVLELEYSIADGWVTEQKLAELGFDTGDNVRYERTERDALVVLELNGPQYQKELKTAQTALASAKRAFAAAPQDPKAKEAQESAQYDVERLQTIATRLYVVDAGLNAASLRERYPDTHQYALAHAGVRFGRRYYDQTFEDNGYQLYADLSDLNVPGQWRDVFNGWQFYDRSAEERSKARVEVAFGKRFEPWIIGAKMVE